MEITVSKKRLKKAVAVFLAFLFAISSLFIGLSVAAFATGETTRITDGNITNGNVIKSGNCGDNAKYDFYADGSVVISGSGAIFDYKFSDVSPFYNSAIKSVVINEGITSIGDEAFENCYGITTVTIPDSVKLIGWGAFSGCTGLEKVCINDISSWLKISFDGSASNPLSYADNLYIDGVCRKDIVIPDGITTIKDYAFYSYKNLDSVTIPDSVKSIGWGAFSGCTGLEKVCINDISSWLKISFDGSASNPLSYADNLYIDGVCRKDIVIPDGITTIKDYAFYGYKNLDSVTIPDSVKLIGWGAFGDCSWIEDVYYKDVGEKWIKIEIESNNEELLNANFHFNACTHFNKTTHAQQNPTCTAKGYTAGIYCPDCENWLSGHEVIPATNHPKKESKPQQNATCTAKGYTAGTYCPDCKKWLSGHSTITAKGHSYTEKIIDSKHLKSKATVASPAIYKYDCAVCDSISPDKTFTHGKALNLGTTSSVTATQTTSSLTLTWDKAPNATGYRLYYKLPGDMSWRTSVSYITATTKTFSGLPSGQAYRFAIRSAYKKADGTYILGGYKQIATATKATAPADVYSFQNSSAIRLIWTASKGATGYRIYYKSGNAWKACVSTTSSTTHTFSNLKAGSKYTFAVRPYILADGVVIWSDYITITTATQTISPVITLTSTSKGNINLSWKAVNGAEAYQVYYKVGNGNYKLYKTYTSVQSLKFANLKSGTKYTFAVRGVIKGSEENIYGFHSPVTVTVK